LAIAAGCPPYDAVFDSKVANIQLAVGTFAAPSLRHVLQRFFEDAKSGCMSTFTADADGEPGRPDGGECQAARATTNCWAALWMIRAMGGGGGGEGGEGG